MTGAIIYRGEGVSKEGKEGFSWSDGRRSADMLISREARMLRRRPNEDERGDTGKKERRNM